MSTRQISQKDYRFWIGQLLVFIITLSIIGLSKQVHSQEKYPTRPIDILVAYSPGGGTDTTTRLLVEYLRKKWNVRINVINKPGGETIPANLELYAAAPDGYTLLTDQEGTSSMVGLVMENLPFKVLDRTFLGTFSYAPLSFMVPSASPYKSLKDAMADAKKDPGRFTWASSGGNHDWFFRLFFREAGVDLSKTQVVRSKGGSGSAAMVAGGHVKIGCSPMVSSRALAKAGTLRYLAIAEERNPEFPEVPTTAELGYPKLNVGNWQGFSGPPKVSNHIVNIVEKTLKEIHEDPEFVSRLNGLGFTAFYRNSAGMRDFVIKQMGEIAELYGIK